MPDTKTKQVKTENEDASELDPKGLLPLYQKSKLVAFLTSILVGVFAVYKFASERSQAAEQLTLTKANQEHEIRLEYLRMALQQGNTVKQDQKVFDFLVRLKDDTLISRWAQDQLDTINNNFKNDDNVVTLRKQIDSLNKSENASKELKKQDSLRIKIKEDQIGKLKREKEIYVLKDKQSRAETVYVVPFVPKVHPQPGKIEREITHTMADKCKSNSITGVITFGGAKPEPNIEIVCSKVSDTSVQKIINGKIEWFYSLRPHFNKDAQPPFSVVHSMSVDVKCSCDELK